VRLDVYADLHPDLITIPGRGTFLGNNPGVSILAAVPYALAYPVVRRVAPVRPAPPNEKVEAEYKEQRSMRLAFYKNDLRNGPWAPNSPTLLCGGLLDPTVFFPVNTGVMAAFWSQLPAGLITVLDVNATPGGPFAALQTGFQESQAAQLAYYESAAGGSLSPAAAQQLIVQGYHGAVAPFCTAAARAFFSQL